MSIDKEVVKNRIKDIEIYYMEIEPFLEFSAQEIINDYPKLRTLERNFQLIVDAMVSINSHFISELNLPVPDDFQSTFMILGQNKILPMDFAMKIAPVVGLRNQVVHQYGKIDKKKFISDFKKENKDFKDYIRFINGYLQKVGK